MFKRKGGGSKAFWTMLKKTALFPICRLPLVLWIFLEETSRFSSDGNPTNKCLISFFLQICPALRWLSLSPTSRAPLPRSTWSWRSSKRYQASRHLRQKLQTSVPLQPPTWQLWSKFGSWFELFVKISFFSGMKMTKWLGGLQEPRANV